MRSSVPIPGDPWPHEMVITIDDDPNPLVELLWIREAWGLQPLGDDLPPLLVDPPDPGMSEGEERDIAGWQAAWPRLWLDTLRHAGGVRDPGLFDALRSTADNSTERADLIAQLMGPSWRDRFGEAGLDERWAAWTGARFQQRVASRPGSFEDQPERRSLEALIAAWRVGLTKIVTIPCHGEYTRTIGKHTLLMTDATRDEVDMFSAALNQFG